MEIENAAHNDEFIEKVQFIAQRFYGLDSRFFVVVGEGDRENSQFTGLSGGNMELEMAAVAMQDSINQFAESGVKIPQVANDRDGLLERLRSDILKDLIALEELSHRISPKNMQGDEKLFIIRCMKIMTKLDQILRNGQ